MATALHQNATYKSLKDNFAKNGINESIACVQGFILGMLAQGFNSGDRQILKYTVELLNDGEPLSGSAIASFTTLLLEMERELSSKKVEFYIPTADDNEQKLDKEKFSTERLTSLADLAYGLSLGYGLTPNGPLKDKDLSAEQRDDLIMLEHIFQLDTSSELEEDDIKEVISYLYTILYRTYDAAHRK